MENHLRRVSGGAISVILAMTLLLGCKSEKPAPAPKPTPPVTPSPTAAIQTPAAQPTTPSATTPTLGISPEAERVFQDMDRAFADSKSRQVSIRARAELKSSVRNFRAQVAIEMKLQFPNLMNIQGTNVTESNDPQTTTTWFPGRLNWGIISDGETMLLKKGFAVTQKAPKTLDYVLNQQIELVSWGESPMINCFLKTRPSTAFRTGDLVAARVVKRTENEIALDLTTKVPLSVRQRAGIPDTFHIVQQVTIDARTMIPKRCYMDLLELRREYHRILNQNEVTVDTNFYEIVIAKVDRNADFSGKGLFVVPKEALSPKRPGGTVPALTPGKIGGQMTPRTAPTSPLMPGTTSPITP